MNSAVEFLKSIDVELKAIELGRESVDSNPMNIEAGVMSDEYATEDLMAIGLDILANQLKELRDYVIENKE
jgi:hypothetical protein